MDNSDPLQTKIEKAKARLSEETLNAIHSVNWRAVIADMAGKSGYSIEQLGDLELETELLLCGLVPPENYPNELETRMGIDKPQVEKLMAELNEKIFEKIRNKLMESTERKKAVAARGPDEQKEFEKAGIKIIDSPPSPAPPLVQETRSEILDKIKEPDPASVPPILAQKLSSTVQMPSTKTVHTLENITKTPEPSGEASSAAPAAQKKYSVDPYREVPE